MGLELQSKLELLTPIVAHLVWIRSSWGQIVRLIVIPLFSLGMHVCFTRVSSFGKRLHMAAACSVSHEPQGGPECF